MAKKNVDAKNKTLDKFNIIILITYLFTWLSGIIVFLISKDNKNNKFHALQAIFLGIIITILSFIPFISIIAFLIWVYGIYIGVMGASGKKIQIPILGKYAEKYSL